MRTGNYLCQFDEQRGNFILSPSAGRNDLSASSQPRPMTVALIESSPIVAERYASFCHRFGDMSQTRRLSFSNKPATTHSRSVAHGRGKSCQNVPAKLQVVVFATK